MCIPQVDEDDEEADIETLGEMKQQLERMRDELNLKSLRKRKESTPEGTEEDEEEEEEEVVEDEDKTSDSGRGSDSDEEKLSEIGKLFFRLSSVCSPSCTTFVMDLTSPKGTKNGVTDRF